VLDSKEIETCLKSVVSVVTPLPRKNDDNGRPT
jgi:cell division protease FtsH